MIDDTLHRTGRQFFFDTAAPSQHATSDSPPRFTVRGSDAAELHMPWLSLASYLVKVCGARFLLKPLPAIFKVLQVHLTHESARVVWLHYWFLLFCGVYSF